MTPDQFAERLHQLLGEAEDASLEMPAMIEALEVNAACVPGATAIAPADAS
jgi:hypothetical protein